MTDAVSLGRALLAPGLAAIALSIVGCGGGSSGSPSGAASGRHAATAPSGAAAATRSTASTSQASGSSLTTSATIHVGGTVVALARGVRASMRLASHHPRVERPWPLAFTVTRAGRAAKASVSYEFLFGSQVVAHRSHYTFTGDFSDVFKWPASAVGYPLTFRAVIVCAGVTLNLDYPVQVTR